MKTWFYAISASQNTSAPEEALSSLVASGAIKPETLTWTQGLPAWAPARQTVPQLFAATMSAPPPIPVAKSAALAPAAVAVAPSAAPAAARRSHEIDYEIHGDGMQLVEVELDPGETVIAEAGAMCYLEEDITFESKMGDGSAPSGGFFGALKSVGKRVLTGESIFMTHFTHHGAANKRRVAFAAPYPGKIVPLNLAEHGGEIICEKGAFLCAAMGTSVSIAFAKKLGVGLFGGEGFILQRLQGDGLAFIHAGGTIVRRELKGEMLRVDTGCLVAMTAGITYDIERAGNLKSMLFGGEGLFLATLRGHGSVWLQSLPFSRMADRILANAPAHGGSSTGEGSVLGGLGRMIGGD